MNNVQFEQQVHEAFEAPLIRAAAGYCPCGHGALMESETTPNQYICPDAECGFWRNGKSERENA